MKPSVNESYTKLKTLKDFKYNPDDLGKYQIVSKEWLRQEAIKWVKDNECIDKMYLFRQFFNITEEEVK